ncbi:MAG: hypothetical protein CMLOHMNK_03629 [Steroidobacteraceae bacterium]|nr:hypothetical protein [Steroidobacteraceae bacterium]
MTTPTQKLLQDLATEIVPGFAASRTLVAEGGEIVPMVNVRDVGPHGIAPVDALEHMSLSKGSRAERYTLRAGDVVVTARGPQLKAAVVTAKTAGALASANLLVVRLTPELLPTTLVGFLWSAAGAAQIKELSRSATSMLSLNAKALGLLRLPVPPIAIQERLADLISSAEQVEASAQRALQIRKRVTQALIDELF